MSVKIKTITVSKKGLESALVVAQDRGRAALGDALLWSTFEEAIRRMLATGGDPIPKRKKRRRGR